ncbi:MAG: hypothetical protein ABIP27_12170 [Flavobacterium circumlabens]|uniref:hypothetical protein n=1 Tax=Flavobacterium circumlabens TaxID=2133765 RepID=UPI0032646307
MKKLLYLFASILLLGCSSSDDNSTDPIKNSINPPKWIQGLWVGNAQSSYEFKSNDWCTLFLTTPICWKDSVDKANGQTTVTETITDNSYIMKLTGNGISQTYTFEKISATRIKATSQGSSQYYDKK